ncbi:MAG: M15 family metallopeptidase [bacterium]|nr:M15 family metallopeptidase [bacterium]
MGFHPVARARLLRWVLLFVVLAVLIIGVAWWRINQLSKKPQSSTSTSPSTSSSSAPITPASFDKSLYSINDPTSIWVVVNKGRVLPSSYVPSDLVVPNVSLGGSAASDNMHMRRSAAEALEKLITAAGSEGLRIMIVSGYRSYGTQQLLYNGYVNTQGKAYADATSAQPGHSEHQTGLTADLGVTTGKCQLEACFGDTPEGKWLAANGHKYGFIIRYQKDKTSLTGYVYEPWHVRFVGVDLAAELNKTSQKTMEQFFELPAYADYPATSYKLSQ